MVTENNWQMENKINRFGFWLLKNIKNIVLGIVLLIILYNGIDIKFEFKLNGLKHYIESWR